MFFTRCPDCDTTFRVTDDALQKANGQVRCGRCASVFNAYAERRDAPGELASAHTPSPSTEPQPSAPTPSAHAAAPPPAPSPASASSPAPAPAPSPASESVLAPDDVPEPLPSNPQPARDSREAAFAPLLESAPRSIQSAAAARATGADGFGSVADVVAQLEIGASDEDAETGEMQAHVPSEAEALSASRVQEVLEIDATPPVQWTLEPDPPRSRATVWTAGVLAAVLGLGVQAANHYRADLAGKATVGPWVQRAYATLGITVLPRWNIRQYEILDWVATAEPNARGQGSLKITARIKNRGPQYQPYPSVQLRLKDRWEAAVGNRVFAPVEYLAAAPRRLMAPGETARAQLEVVDPGPDAYGFELDVCIEVETHRLSCGSDKVFL